MSGIHGLRRFESTLDTTDIEYVENYKHNLGLVQELNDRLKEWKHEGSEKRVAQIRKAGKLLASERLALLLDEDSPWLEIGPLNGWGQEEAPIGNSLLGGIGVINGVECMVVVNVPTVQAASMNPVTSAKWHRCSQISMENRLPFIQLLESAGADLNKQFEAFHDAPNAFYQLAQRSKARVPSVCLVMGTCIAGGAYMAGMSDYIIMIKKQSQLGLAGQKLVYMATLEESTDEELGGASMHSRVSGVSDFLANDEKDAIRQAREVIATFPVEKKGLVPAVSGVEEPFYPPQELLGLVSRDIKQGYDCREVMARFVDGSFISEFKPTYGASLVCAFAYIYGVPVGLIGNNGVIMSESAQKGTHFINLCNQRGVPLVFLHHVTGFMVGRKYEESGIIKWGSQLVNAVSNTDVPVFTFIIGNSFGAANFALKGRGFEPRFIFSWPMSKCAVMGPEQLSGVLDLLSREGARKKGREVDEEKLLKKKTFMADKIKREQSAYFTSSRMVDDGVVDPRDTRMILGMCLSVVANQETKKGFLEGISRL